MKLLIVPNVVSDAINGEIDRALAGRPIQEEERERIFKAMLNHWDETGTLGELTLEKKAVEQ
jgi:hypothetical protein